MSHLIKYEAARQALAECKSVDEVKGWSDKAAAMQAYGRMAKDKDLEVIAAEIRIRAERRLGQMLAEQKASGGLSKGAAGNPGGQGARFVRSSEMTAQTPTLADAGISKNLSSRSQKLAAVPDAEFEAEVGEWKERVKAENARVSARLQQAGERAVKHEAPAVEDDDGAPSVEEEAFLRRQVEADAERVRVLLESDDALAEVTAKWQQEQMLRISLQGRLEAMQTENNVLIREVKRWQRIADRAERSEA